jgi:hypothetical protein
MCNEKLFNHQHGLFDARIERGIGWFYEVVVLRLRGEGKVEREWDVRGELKGF